jgi:hypothetical protein
VIMARGSRYYTMGRKDMSHMLAPLEQLLGFSGAVSVGIGDGGNEVGMGLVLDKVIQHVPDGEWPFPQTRHFLRGRLDWDSPMRRVFFSQRCGGSGRMIQDGRSAASRRPTR